MVLLLQNERKLETTGIVRWGQSEQKKHKFTDQDQGTKSEAMGLQIAQNRSLLCTLGPKVRIIILVALRNEREVQLGEGQPAQSQSLFFLGWSCSQELETCHA